MSTLKPVININPNYATNNIDTLQAGLYQYAPNNSNIIVRVNTLTNIGLSGEIKLNTTLPESTFQGYNGTEWVDFNATQGPQGEPGQDFANVVNFNNLQLPGDTLINVNTANIFATTSINAALGVNNVNIRSLKSGVYDVNSNLNITTLNLSQNSNIITLTSNPIPYIWNFTTTNNTINYLKNAVSNPVNFSWGETSNWIVKQGTTVNKGQAVKLTSDTTTTNLVITPLTYTTLTSSTPFNTSLNMLGIACETATGGSSCVVCTKGITTVLCTNNITTDFIVSTDIPEVGRDGVIGRDGGIFYPTTPPNLINYIRAGYFLESGIGKATAGNYVLFYVEPRFQFN